MKLGLVGNTCAAWTAVRATAWVAILSATVVLAPQASAQDSLAAEPIADPAPDAPIQTAPVRTAPVVPPLDLLRLRDAPDAAEPVGLPETVLPPSIALDGVLLPGEVMAVTRETFPQILQREAELDAALGRQQATLGTFDTRVSAEGFSRATGFWDGTVVETEARRRLVENGTELYAGYRLSDGSFPIYEDVYFTNELGEAKVGAIFALLRDRSIDRERFDIADAQLATEAAEIDILLTQLSVQQRALTAYWQWVAAGRTLGVFRDLVTLARERQTALERQYEAGAVPRLVLLENRQSLTRRRILLEGAERELAVATNELAFFLRGPDGSLRAPGPDSVPDYGAFAPLSVALLPSVASVGAGLDAAISERPELAALRTAVARAQGAIALGENDLKPALDLRAELSRDFGAIAEGGPSRDSTDLIVGFEFSVPLGRTKARGRIREAEARLRAAELEQRQLRDRIEVEVRNILTRFLAALDLASLARDFAEQSEQLVDAETAKFQSGASDFFLINLREQEAADARIRYLRADMEARIARVNYAAATVDLGFLGLGARPPVQRLGNP